METTVTNQICVHEEIKSRLMLRNACCRSVQNRLSSFLRSKNVKIKIYKNMILLVFVWCETWFVTLREEHRLKWRDIFVSLGVDGRIILEWILWEEGGKVCTGFIWLKIETCGGLLWTRSCSVGFHKGQGTSWLAERLVSISRTLLYGVKLLVRLFLLKL
jgi:hypothetical protein